MQLDHLDPKLVRGIDLFESWIDKQTHADTGGLESLDRRFEFFAIRDDVEAALRRDFFTFFGNETDFVGNNF